LGLQGPALSVVVPLYNEEDNVTPLVASVREALGELPSWELVLVDDGSRDATATVAAGLAAADPRVRLLRLARNYGQTQAMQAGFDSARGDVVVSMDGDLQNDPRDIPTLVAKLHEGYDLVAGYRVRRHDTFLTRKVPSWVANRLIAWLTGVRIRDNGCSLKAYRRSVLERLDLYSDMHRFLPALAAATADARITEVPVRHHARRFGQSKYGLSRIAKVSADLLAIKMISSFRERPLTLFGTGALATALLGVAIVVAWMLVPLDGPRNVHRVYVLPAAALLAFALACFLLMLGLIAVVALHATREASRGLARDGGVAAPPAAAGWLP
jgi:glycosyltransferase involved in cell wall biosynthesis